MRQPAEHRFLLVERFRRSRHAVSLPPELAGIALQSLLVFRERAPRRRDGRSDFDAEAYVTWLGAQSLIHPAAVPELYRCWRRALDWLVLDGQMLRTDADAIFDDLCDLEHTVLHHVIDGWLRMAS